MIYLKTISLFVIFIVVTFVTSAYGHTPTHEAATHPSHVTSIEIIRKETILKGVGIVPRMEYRNIAPVPKWNNLFVFQKETKYGVSDAHAKVLKTLRFYELADSICSRYGYIFPPEFLLAFPMSETGGCEFIVNQNNDGGAGLSHMQPSTAHFLGLRVACDNYKTIDRDCCGALTFLFQKHKGNRAKLLNYDDRLNHLKNLDGIARLAIYELMGLTTHKLKKSNAKNAVEYIIGALGPNTYNARTGYRKFSRPYIAKFLKNLQLIKSPDVYCEVSERFNIKNVGITTFEEYVSQWQYFFFENFNINEYSRMPKINVDEEQKLLFHESFQNIIEIL